MEKKLIKMWVGIKAKALVKMWVGNVVNALLHFLCFVNNTLSLCQRVQIYLGPTFVGRPNEIFKTKLCLIRMYSVHQTVLNAKKQTLEGWSNYKNPFWSSSHHINAIPSSQQNQNKGQRGHILLLLLLAEVI